MRVPISFALTYPERAETPLPGLDLAGGLVLEFEAPDLETFPLLALARRAGEQGGTYPCAFNAANEVAVAAFLEGRLPFLGIAETVEETLADGTGAFELESVGRLAPALERLRTTGIHVVLLDLTLPDSAGLGTFTSVRANAPDVPIIVLTGLSDESLAVSTVRDGAQDYLIKGQVDGNLLGRTIRYAIERQHVRHELEHPRSSDPRQDREVERRRAQRVSFPPEHVPHGALGDPPLLGEKQGIISLRHFGFLGCICEAIPLRRLVGIRLVRLRRDD